MTYRVILIDYLGRRALVAFRHPGEKVCARIKWVGLGALMLAAAMGR